MRDLDLLISAASRLQATFGGYDLYPSLFSKAAALIHSLVLNHPFIDGNKRTAMVSTARFLFINGYILKISKREIIDLSLRIESKKLVMEDLAVWFKKHSKRI